MRKNHTLFQPIILCALLFLVILDRSTSAAQPPSSSKLFKPSDRFYGAYVGMGGGYVHSHVKARQTFTMINPAFIGLQNFYGQTTEHNISGQSLYGTFFGGYGRRMGCRGYIGAEFNFSLQSAQAKESIDQNTQVNIANSIFTVSAKDEVGAFLRLGYEIVDHAMMSLYLGATNARWEMESTYPSNNMQHFAQQQGFSYIYTTDSRRMGAGIGIGAEFLLGANAFMGIKMEYKKYQSMKAHHKATPTPLASFSIMPSLYSFSIRFGYIF